MNLQLIPNPIRKNYVHHFITTSTTPASLTLSVSLLKVTTQSAHSNAIHSQHTLHQLQLLPIVCWNVEVQVNCHQMLNQFV